MMQRGEQSQVIVVTHSPILMALPDAQLMRMGKYGLESVELEDTDHFRMIRQFALDPHGIVGDMLDA